MQLICGLWNIDGRPAERQTLAAMCAALQSPVHPGTVSLWIDGPVGFGLLTFQEPVSALHAHLSGRVTVADVRLDDAVGAHARYGLPLGSASELMGKLSVPDEAAHLHGDYAVAQWQPFQRVLSLTRDALGIRPLCYYHRPGHAVAFASLPVALLASGLLSPTLNRQQLAKELLGYPAAEATLFQGICNVLPGTSALFSPERETTLRYWQAEPRPPLSGSREAAAEQLRGLLQHAVNSCLPAAGPVAAHLSGGLDSSAVAVAASRTLQGQGRHLLAYSFLSDTWPGIPMEGERPYVDAVLQQEPAIQWRAVDAVFSPEWLHDQWDGNAPLVLSHGSPENAVCVHAAAQGASVVLSGWGGDEGITFNGRGAFAAALRQGRWLWLHQQLRAMRRERGFSLRNMLMGDVLGPQLAPATRQRLRRKRRNEEDLPPLANFLQPALLNLAAGTGPVYTAASPAIVQAGLLRDGHLSFRAGRFAAVGARYGMAFRFPLLNRQVVEFALSMPPAWHIHAGWKRRLFREAMQGILPPAVQWRHTKFRSLPAVPYQLTRERDRVVQRVEQLAKNRLLTELFRMDRVAAVLRSLPVPDAVTDPAAHPALRPLPGVAQLLDYAFFLEAHMPTPHQPDADTFLG